MRTALVISILVHGAALLVARPIAARLAASAPEEAAVTDLWAGTSIEVSLGGDGAGEPTAGSESVTAPASNAAKNSADDAAPASPPSSPAPTAAPSTKPSSAAVDPPKAPPKKKADSAPSATARAAEPAPTASASASASATTSAAPTPGLRLPDIQTAAQRGKEKREREAREKAARQEASSSPKPEASSTPVASAKPSSTSTPVASAKPAATSTPVASAKPAATSTPVASAKPAATSMPVAPASTSAVAAKAGAPAGSGGPAGGTGTAGTFGSEGAASVRDLGRAFTRAIPAACSADPVWAKLAAGDAGKLLAEVRVDADGHVTSAEPLGKDPPKALVNVLRRTLPMLQGGTFAVRGGTVTAGVETLEITATVSDEASAEEGAKDKLSFSYSGDHGKASFTQTSGRKVDISVRVVKVVAAD